MNELNRTSPIPDAAAVAARLMAEFAMRTGLCPGAQEQRRYLWTDAFAVCNFLELFQRTSDQQYRRCAEKLIDQVHSVLGQYRNDDARHKRADLHRFWLRSVRAPGNSGSSKNRFTVTFLRKIKRATSRFTWANWP